MEYITAAVIIIKMSKDTFKFSLKNGSLYHDTKSTMLTEVVAHITFMGDGIAAGCLLLVFGGKYHIMARLHFYWYS